MTVPESRIELDPAAVVTLATLIAYADGRFDRAERAAVVAIAERALAAGGARKRGPRPDAATLAAIVDRLSAEMDELGDGAPRELPGAGDTLRATRARVRALELFRRLPGPDRTAAFQVVKAILGVAQGADSREARLLGELQRLFTDEVPDARPIRAPLGTMTVLAPIDAPLVHDNHPLLEMLEQRYSPHPVELASQLARDHTLIDQALAAWGRQREQGLGTLAGAGDIRDVPADTLYLDRFAYALRPSAGRVVDLIVLGDLHGCYSCLKAALLQSDFLSRVWAHQRDPEHYPDVKLVCLGDYIDRGRFGFDGVLRTVLQLFVTMPENVILLRGNHEDFVEVDGRITSRVHPADSLFTLAAHAPPEALDGFRALFEAIPTSFIFDRTLFVHGGIPRDETTAAVWRDLSSLNDPRVRLEMMWSDPSAVDHVPQELQRQTARFSFGRQQLRRFLDRVGCHTLVRGHERFDNGFQVLVDGDGVRLVSLFSAGGATNADLPEDSSYRQTVPMAAVVRHEHGRQSILPWAIAWELCNAPHRNRLLWNPWELERRSG